MREYLRGLKLILLFVILAFIVTSFLYFSSDLRMGNARSNAVASVNGEEIPPARFPRMQRNSLVLPARLPAEHHAGDGGAPRAHPAGDQRSHPGGPRPPAGEARGHHGQRRRAAAPHPVHSRLPGGWPLLA